jgi:hypothetical protein
MTCLRVAVLVTLALALGLAPGSAAASPGEDKGGKPPEVAAETPTVNVQ